MNYDINLKVHFDLKVCFTSNLNNAAKINKEH